MTISRCWETGIRKPWENPVRTFGPIFGKSPIRKFRRCFKKVAPRGMKDSRCYDEQERVLEEPFFSFSYSPIKNDQGRVIGLFCALTGETGQVLKGRRLNTLRQISTVTARSELSYQKVSHCFQTGQIWEDTSGAGMASFAGFSPGRSYPGRTRRGIPMDGHEYGCHRIKNHSGTTPTSDCGFGKSDSGAHAGTETLSSTPANARRRSDADGNTGSDGGLPGNCMIFWLNCLWHAGSKSTSWSI